MTDAPNDPVLLARDIADDLAEVTQHLPQATPQQTALIIESVVEMNEGVLGRLNMLLEAASHYTFATRGTFSPELCLALGLAAERLDRLRVALDAHWVEIHRRATTDSVANSRQRAPSTPRASQRASTGSAPDAVRTRRP